MKAKLQRFLIDVLVKLLVKESPTRGSLQEKDYVKAMSKLYQNPAFSQYCENREAYLTKYIINLLAKDQLADARGVTGQLLELRTLQQRAMTCYYKTRKESL